MCLQIKEISCIPTPCSTKLLKSHLLYLCLARKDGQFWITLKRKEAFALNKVKNYGYMD